MGRLQPNGVGPRSAEHPQGAHPEILRRAGEILDARRGADGRRTLDVHVRYTLGSA